MYYGTRKQVFKSRVCRDHYLSFALNEVDPYWHDKPERIAQAKGLYMTTCHRDEVIKGQFLTVFPYTVRRTKHRVTLRQLEMTENV